MFLSRYVKVNIKLAFFDDLDIEMITLKTHWISINIFKIIIYNLYNS